MHSEKVVLPAPEWPSKTTLRKFLVVYFMLQLFGFREKYVQKDFA